MTAGSHTLREAGAFLLFLALAIALTWPLTRGISRFVSDLGDPLLNAWILDWDCHALTHAPLRLFDAPIFFPAKYPLAYSENLLGIAVLVLPFWLAGCGPITVYNIAMLLGFALSAYGAYVLARTCSASFPAAIAAGVFFAFVPFKFDHLAHVQIINSGWLPLMLAALVAFWQTPSIRRAAMFGAAFVMNGLTNVHYLLFGGLTVGLTIVFLAIADRRRDRRFWMTLGGALLAGSLVLLPVLLPYRAVSKEYGMRRGVAETIGGSATPRDWLVASPRSRWYGNLPDPAYEHAERSLFPGLAPLFLAGFGFFLRRRRTTTSATPDLPPLTPRQRTVIRWLDVLMIVCAAIAYFGAVMSDVRWTMNGRLILAFGTAGVPLTILVAAAIIRCTIRVPHALARGEQITISAAVNRSRFTHAEWSAALWILIGFLGTFGLNAFFHQFLYRFVPVFQSIRAPARWAVIAYLGLAVWMAVGIDEILRRVLKNFRRTAVAAAFIALAIVDVAPLIRWESALVEPAPVYRWLSAERVGGPILELPMNLEYAFFYLLAATSHHIPIMNGISGFEPPLHGELRGRDYAEKLDETYTALLEQNGCRYIVVHADWLRFQRNATFRWLQRGLATGRLAFLRRFDHGANGDWVFAVTRNAHDWQRLSAPDVPDRTGHTPRANLARLFAEQHVYNETTFGYVDAPKRWTEVRGPLAISGWALSPKGVQRVIVHLNNDRQQFDAELFPRPDINHYFGDLYPQTTRAGFRFTIPRRPRGVHVDTDFQIEVIDGSGRSTWLSDMPIWWR